MLSIVLSILVISSWYTIISSILYCTVYNSSYACNQSIFYISAKYDIKCIYGVCRHVHAVRHRYITDTENINKDVPKNTNLFEDRRILRSLPVYA